MLLSTMTAYRQGSMLTSHGLGSVQVGYLLNAICACRWHKHRREIPDEDQYHRYRRLRNFFAMTRYWDEFDPFFTSKAETYKSSSAAIVRE